MRHHAGGRNWAVASAYARYTLVTDPGNWPLGEAAAWIATWAFFPVLALVLTLVVVYPTGRPSRLGRWVLLTFLSVALVDMVVYAIRPGPVEGDTPPNNPLGIPGTGDMLDSMTGWLGTLLGVIALVALVDVFLRFRRSVGVERLQFRWFFIAIAMFPVMWFGSIFLEEFGLGVEGFDPVVIGFALWGNGTAAAIGVAITRHGLYEIDRIISRTVSYAVVVGLLAAVYLGTLPGSRLCYPIDRNWWSLPPPWGSPSSSTRFAAGYRVRWSVASTVPVMTRNGSWMGSPARCVIRSTATRWWTAGSVCVSETMQPAAVGVWVREAT